MSDMVDRLPEMRRVVDDMQAHGGHVMADLLAWAADEVERLRRDGWATAAAFFEHGVDQDAGVSCCWDHERHCRSDMQSDTATCGTHDAAVLVLGEPPP